MSTSSMRGLSQAIGQPFDSSTDPLGISLMQRAQANQQAGAQAQTATDYGSNNVLAQGVHMMGPLPDPRWEGFLQALTDAGGGAPMKLRGQIGNDPSNDVTMDPVTMADAPLGQVQNRRGPQVKGGY